MPKRSQPEKKDNSHSKKLKPETTLPLVLEELQKKFEAVNIFSAFCDARLTSSLTFQSLQKAVDNLTIEDLCAINVIIPNFVKFNAVSDEIMEIEFGRPVNKSIAKQKHAAALGNRGDQWLQSGFKKDTAIPSLKPDAVKKMIDQKNKLFIKCMDQFLKHCAEKNLDVKQHLLYELEKHMPAPFFDPFEELDIELMSEQNEVKTLHQVIEGLQSLHFYDNQLSNDENRKVFPEKDPIYDTIDMSEAIHDALKRKGIHQLYVHQTKALKGLYDGQHVIVSTSTASGKSLIYQLPVLESLLRDKSSKAMYIFPTKALAQDQMRALMDMMAQIPELEGITISTFDGDTPNEKRAYIRNNASVIFTNPDMLHHAILPNVKLWNHFLSSLKYVVVDGTSTSPSKYLTTQSLRIELHVYHGLFGTHMAFIMRRLRRLCHLLGQDRVQFISCSATITNPDQHMKAIFGIDHVKLVDVDGAPHGKKEFIVWNPARHTPSDDMSERRSAVIEGADLLEYLIEHEIRTIAFCKVRKTCELLMKQLRENLQQKQRKDILDKVMSYRGGYTAEDRRQIERQMFSGELLGIIATNALELGVDIGSLDAVLMIGVPWSVSALWQQSGRSGRRNTDSLSLVVCDGNPLDQYYAHHPSELFKKTPDELSIQIEDSIVLESHIQCAAEESPINTIDDQVYFGKSLPALCEEHLVQIDHGMYRPNPRFRPYPSQFVNIRKINEDPFVVVDVTNGRKVILEEIEVHRAGFEIYEGAIFIHQGITYLVEECDIDKRIAKVHLTRVDWTTRQRDFTNVDAESTDMSNSIGETRNFVHYGKVKVSTVVFGYHRIDKRGRIIDTHDVYMDPIITTSTGIWAYVPKSALDQMSLLDIDPMAGIHAACHCLISLLPRFATSSSKDIRTECKNPNATRHRPAQITLYETEPSGIVRQAFKFFDGLIDTSIQTIEECVCQGGCPLCIHSTSCSEQNQVCDKKGSLIVLRALRGHSQLI